MASPLRLSPTNKPVREFYAALSRFQEQGHTKETSIRGPFQDLLSLCARRKGWQFVPEFPLTGEAKGRFVDGALQDSNWLIRGYWEAKDGDDDLDKEIAGKFALGYPRDNILFQTPSRIVIFQGGNDPVFDESIDRPKLLVEALQLFFEYRTQEVADWDTAVDAFRETIPELGKKLVGLIETQRKGNRAFVDAFEDFATLCRQSINPNLSDAALEEMLVQHILTERIFRSVFDTPDFVQRNAIATEIEKVVTALTSKTINRAEFMKPLARFYDTLEATARSIEDFSAKQGFLNSVYERFFQGFAVKVADTMGIVYTPQPIVDFMVRSVEELLQQEFGLSLGSPGVHIIDPFVGTGNFMVRILREISPAALPHKYAHELHCNEVMLLPYYIASLNIEHAYLERVGQYQPFPGICFVDTFELAEARNLGLFTEDNTQRVERQRAADMMVIIGNPPYNAHQVNENDNNKNRKYVTIDRRVRDTYAKDSQATNKNALTDPYVKAFRWAADRLREKKDQRGIVAFVTNNSFLEDHAFDGMRKHLLRDFDAAYVLDLRGNVRKNPKISGTTHNVFGIQVGVCITLLVRLGGGQRAGSLRLARVGDSVRRKERFSWLRDYSPVHETGWKLTRPRPDEVWIQEGLRTEFGQFPSISSKQARRATPSVAGTESIQAIFKMYSNCVKTNRDVWVYNYDPNELANNIHRMIDAYNDHLARWQQHLGSWKGPDSVVKQKERLEQLIDYGSGNMAWSRDLKASLIRQIRLQFDESKARSALYRPYCQQLLYFDSIVNEEVYSISSMLPNRIGDSGNWFICLTALASEKPFMSLELVSKIFLDLQAWSE